MLFKALKTHFGGDTTDELRRTSKRESKKSINFEHYEDDKEFSESQSSASFVFSEEDEEINNFNLE